MDGETSLATTYAASRFTRSTARHHFWAELPRLVGVGECSLRSQLMARGQPYAQYNHASSRICKHLHVYAGQRCRSPVNPPPWSRRASAVEENDDCSRCIARSNRNPPAASVPSATSSN